ncbi:type I restriction endonuclease subunit R [Blautia hansenii]|uniref:Type I restriction enzyme endonuclease subunit n=1 Tax=Blautia hansenii DSM 20583 TaxID=537007 RepID=C9LAY0_BLAHA|nr:type I restriction endonuclease subunit R [Blautia hansenii]ASM69101.1 DEAD/DEAH box helicase [Blautia hansenii DSM 20583]EEX20615.1 type I site-specific deoxyribonuclease, HsdR family [Blautia hansenii DSM 20583]UWO11690.1 type I restriction endonuclease subunit R [Blautia hansenii DSM 20583]
MPYFNIVAATNENTVVTEYEPVKSRSDSYQSEVELEKEFIRLLCEQGYTYLPIHTEKDLIANLRERLEELNNYKFSDSEWDRFFNEAIANPNDKIEDKTRKIQEDFVQVLKRDDALTKNILLIDRKNIHNNRLQVINQYVIGTEQGAKHDNRYDVTILVNGLPLVHVELKRRGVAIREAFNQINRYQRDSFWAGSGLFEYAQIFVISNGTNTKYYSNSTRFNAIKDANSGKTKKEKTSNSFEFTSFWADANNKVIPDLIDFTKTFFAKHTILNILTKYCVFTSENMLMVMRPYQITATERILNRIEIAHNYKKYGDIAGGGYIWHTTGSGKTLTSFKTARLASNLKFVDKVLFVVDRKDLDYQTMKEYDRFEKGAANSNSSTVILERQLRDSKSHIIITTIQKLSSFIKKYKEHAVYNKQVVIIFDECHRSQFGDMHAAIVRNFKKYYMFGFTGTPIFPANSGTVRNPKFFTTEQTFGDQLHTYTIVDAINDKNVLPFRVDYIKTMDTDADIDDEQVWDIDRKKAFEAPERITLVAKYILEHFDQKTYRGDKTYVYNALTNIAEVASADRGKVEEIKQKQRISGFNSIFAVSSVPMAKLYYDEFRRQIKADPTKNLKIAVIYSYGANEKEADGILDEENPEDTSALDQTARDFLESAILDYNQMFHTNYDTSSDKFQNYYKDVSLRMKNKELDLLIVVNMFLTGFDATTLNTLWVDKNLKMHGLIQAFSRTNRILNSIKTFGNIVCFRNLQKRVDAAISLFGDKNAGGIVLIKSFKDYYYGCESIDGKSMPGYVDMIEELSDKFPLTEPQIIGEQNQKDFIALFGAILRMRNLLLSFDEFAGKEGITERDLQDYLGRYQDLRDEWKRKRENGESVDIIDDIVFEVELIKQIEINIDYILMLVKKYHDTHGEDKEVLITIRKAIDASPELRSKKALIENFISGINDMDDVMLEWKEYVVVQRERDLENIIEQEKLKPNEARKFLENCFREGEVKTTGTDIDKLMPPVSRFGGSGARAKKKKKVIDLLRAFFEKYSGLGMATFKAKQEEDKVVTYDFTQQPMSMVAENPVKYGKKD